MAKKKCGGCGVELQSENKNIPGYLPENKIKEASPVCQRCFKIKNYGAYVPVSLTDADYKKEVTTILKNMDIVIVVVDVIDFEGSFDAELISLIKKKKVILAVNKIDLVPGRKHPAEITNWLNGRLFLAGITPADIVIMSTKTKYGVNVVIRKLRYFLPKGGNVAVIGATNVGKSSLINGLFGKNTVTVSKYPGTTLKTVKFQLPKTQTFIHDTPGIIPKGRISDMVCESCNLKIVPSTEISRKTFKLPYDRVFMFGGLVWMRILTDYETAPIFTAYAAKEVQFHETNVDKVEALLKEKTGNQKEIRDYVMGFDESKEFFKRLTDMLDYLIPKYIKEGKSHLTIGIACTGGKHRSVTFVNELYDYYKKSNTFEVMKHHRDVEK